MSNKGPRVLPDNKKALARVTYAYIEGLGRAYGEIERYRKSILHALELLDEAYAHGVGEESAVYLAAMETELRESLAADGGIRMDRPAVAGVKD